MNRGIKASELVQKLQDLIKEYGDLDVYKEQNGNIRPIYFITHYPNTDYFELT